MNARLKVWIGVLVAAALLGTAVAAPTGTTKITGTLTVEVKDFKDRHTILDLYVTPDTAKGKTAARLHLSIPKGRGDLARLLKPGPNKRQALTGSKVRVKGKQRAGTLEFDTETLEIVEPLTNPLAMGPQATAVFSVTFSDKPGQAYSLDSLRTLVFTTTNNFDRENSFGKTWLTGDVIGPYTIAQASTVCETNTTAQQARAAATAAGVNLSQYTRQVFVFPNNACGWWGMATVGGTNSSAFINGDPELQVVAHEMGHNFGMLHSHDGTCTGADTCTIGSEYGDSRCNMGYSSEDWNAYQREVVGWMNATGTPPILTAGVSGTYVLDPLEGAVATVNPKAIKTGHWYFEYRGSGARRLLVHHGNLSDINSSIAVVQLAQGQTWTAPDGSVSCQATTLAAAATVQITFTGTPPTAVATATAVPATATRIPATATRTPGTGPSPTPGTGVNFSTAFDFPDAETLGPNWTQIKGQFLIRGKQAVTSPVVESAAVSVAGGTTQTVAIDFTSNDNNLGPRYGVIMRWGGTGYILAYRQTGGSSQLRIARVNAAGAETLIGTQSIANPQKGVSFRMSASAQGTRVTMAVGTVTLARDVGGTATAGGMGFLIGNKNVKVQQAADNFEATAR